MSFTAAFSKLHRIDESGKRTSKSPKILDWEEFEQVAKDVDLSEDVFHDIVVLKDRTDRSEYPERRYKHLFGFKSWTVRECIGFTKYNDPEDFEDVGELFQKFDEVLEEENKRYSTGGLGFFCNIERFGIPYGTSAEVILRFFARVSKATEPFVVWHSNKENDFTNLYDMDLNDLEEEVVYRIECRDGDGEIYKVQFCREAEEKITELHQDGEDKQW